jgi:dienelactone hydrolase
MATDALASFDETTFAFDGTSRSVYRAGSGPGVVVIHELPGITPQFADFGRRLVDAGFTVAMPSLLGEPGREASVAYTARSVWQGCVSREFTTWATNRTSPVITWLRALARDLHEQTGGPGVGAVGMCFTGGFALAMAVDETMRAPVCSQPSLPFAVGKARSRALGLSGADLALVRDRPDLCLMALRFANDRMVPESRFAALREALGERVIVVEIENRPGNNPYNIRKAAHSVLTEDLVDEPGHPTKDALDHVLQFLKERLAG